MLQILLHETTCVFAASKKKKNMTYNCSKTVRNEPLKKIFVKVLQLTFRQTFIWQHLTFTCQRQHLRIEHASGNLASKTFPIWDEFALSWLITMMLHFKGGLKTAQFDPTKLLTRFTIWTKWKWWFKKCYSNIKSVYVGEIWHFINDTINDKWSELRSKGC